MHSISLALLGFIAVSPLVHADAMGGYVKSMFQPHPAVTQSEAPMDPRLYSIWSSFHKMYNEVEHAATAATTTTTTTSSYPTSTGDLDDLPTSEQIYTLDISETSPLMPAPTESATLYSTVTSSVSSVPLPLTATTSVETSPVVPVSSTVQPSQNTTVTSTGTSTASSTRTRGTSRPTKVPPPLNGVPKNTAPLMGAAVAAIAGCLMF